MTTRQTTRSGRHTSARGTRDSQGAGLRRAKRLAAYSAATGAAALGAGQASAVPTPIAGLPETIGPNGTGCVDVNGDGQPNICSNHSAGQLGPDFQAFASLFGFTPDNMVSGMTMESELEPGTLLPFVTGVTPLAPIGPDGTVTFLADGYLVRGVHKGSGPAASTIYVDSAVPLFSLPFLIGFQAEIPNGSPHFGWLRVQVNELTPGDPNSLVVNILDGAYESEPNTSILAGVPEPATLGLLATGAVGVLAHRRRRDGQAV